MLLKKVLKGLDVQEIIGNPNIEIGDVAYDSRDVGPGALFVCIDGFKADGHKFVNMAVSNGAVAVLVQKPIQQIPGNIVVLRVSDTRYALAHVSNIFFGNLSHKLNIVGVTGTKGKTTTTYMLKKMLETNNKKVGLIGTISNFIGDEVLKTERTTPESCNLQKILHRMYSSGVKDVVMEVSSHALDLSRVGCMKFEVGVFTNLSHEHLDFHDTLENYLSAKLKLFNMCKIGLSNADNKYGRVILERANCRMFSYGMGEGVDFRATNIRLGKHEVEFDLTSKFASGRIKVGIPGKFTVYNALAAAGAACLVNVQFASIAAGLCNLNVPGRAELVPIDENYSVMVDYAHTPDSLENILKAIREYAEARVICVFGCGGDRDKTKRPMMGEIAAKLADFVILTSDNPRTEEPDKIIEDIEKGMKPKFSNYAKIADRRTAIEYALQHANANDMILIAGKGHETYQIFKNRTYHFSDKEVVLELAQKLAQDRDGHYVSDM